MSVSEKMETAMIGLNDVERNGYMAFFFGTTKNPYLNSNHEDAKFDAEYWDNGFRIAKHDYADGKIAATDLIKKGEYVTLTHVQYLELLENQLKNAYSDCWRETYSRRLDNARKNISAALEKGETPTFRVLADCIEFSPGRK
jgi:hypothetical protein